MTPNKSRYAASNTPATTRTGGFAIYHPATETCTPAMLRTGQPTGHPNDAFDTAAIIHLVDCQQWPSRI